MKEATRFAEYSISGGLFWLNVMLFIALAVIPASETNMVAGALSIWSEWLQELSSQFANVSSGLESILFAAGVLTIFFTGLMLDLISPRFFSPLEAYFFKKKFLEPNQQWLEPLLLKNDLFLQQSYTRYMKSNWFHCCVHEVKNYDRVKSFILSYIYTYANESRLSELTEKSQIWRTSRSLATSMLMLAALLSLSYSVFMSSDTLSAARLGATVIGAPLILLAVSFSISLSMFQRLWVSNAAIIYTTILKEQKDLLPQLSGSTTQNELKETVDKLKKMAS